MEESSNGLTVLVADDDPIMIRLLELHLRRSGFHSVVFEDGAQALEGALQSPPDLALVDLMLPGLSGLEVLQRFKSDSALKQVPVIIVTGQGRDSVRDELLAAGAERVFTKPFSPKALIEEVRRQLGRETSD